MKRSKILSWLMMMSAFLGCAEEPLIEDCYIQDITPAYLSHTKNDPDYLNNYTIKLERIAGERISAEFTVSINEYRTKRHLGYTQLKVSKETPIIEEQ